MPKNGLRRRIILTVISLGAASVAVSTSAQEQPLPKGDKIDVPDQCLELGVEKGMPTIYHRESLIDQPQLLHKQEMTFPTQPTRTRDFYCAAFMYSIGADGRVKNIEMLYNSHPDIDGINFGQQARQVLQSWQYQPGMIDKAPEEFIGFSAVFFKGFGDRQNLAALRQKAGTASRVKNDISQDWKNYGRRVTQSELELLEDAANSKTAPQELIQTERQNRPLEEKVKIPTSWIVTDDGTVMTDDQIYKPGETKLKSKAVQSAPESALMAVTWSEEQVSEIEPTRQLDPVTEQTAQDDKDILQSFGITPSEQDTAVSSDKSDFPPLIQE
ncbi:MAG: hypothetical protein ACWA5L_10415 [bacterium]